MGVYKLKVPTPLRHYNLNMVASNQSLEIKRKSLLTIKWQVLTPQKEFI